MGVLAALIGMLVQGMAACNFAAIRASEMFWFLMGLAMAAARLTPPRARVSTRHHLGGSPIPERFMTTLIRAGLRGSGRSRHWSMEAKEILEQDATDSKQQGIGYPRYTAG